MCGTETTFQASVDAGGFGIAEPSAEVSWMNFHSVSGLQMRGVSSEAIANVLKAMVLVQTANLRNIPKAESPESLARGKRRKSRLGETISDFIFILGRGIRATFCARSRLKTRPNSKSCNPSVLRNTRGLVGNRASVQCKNALTPGGENETVKAGGAGARGLVPAARTAERAPVPS